MLLLHPEQVPGLLDVRAERLPAVGGDGAAGGALLRVGGRQGHGGLVVVGVQQLLPRVGVVDAEVLAQELEGYLGLLAGER